MVIKKIFDGIFDDEVHSSFLKFGKGEYKDKFLIYGKKQSTKFSIKAGSEFANFLVKKCLEKSSPKVNITGVIVATTDLSKSLTLPFGKISNFQGVRKHAINSEVESSKILDAMNKFPRAFFALSFKGDNFELKIKPKAPTSGKPGKDSEEEPKAEFCSLKTSDNSIINELFFDQPQFNETFVSHILKVEGIVYPKNLASLSPPEVREQSKRQGVVIRRTVADGKEKTTEAKFTA